MDRPPSEPHASSPRPVIALLLEFGLPFALSLLDRVAVTWLTFRANQQGSERNETSAPGDVFPNGGAGMPVPDVRKRTGTTPAKTDQGLGVPNWRNDAPRAGNDPSRDGGH